MVAQADDQMVLWNVNWDDGLETWRWNVDYGDAMGREHGDTDWLLNALPSKPGKRPNSRSSPGKTGDSFTDLTDQKLEVEIRDAQDDGGTHHPGGRAFRAVSLNYIT